MVKTGMFAVMMASAGLFSGAAAAGPAYSSGDIVKFFTESADMGASRGLCVGTESECRNGTSPAKGFDMLVSFDLDSATLTSAARENLEQFAVALKDNRLGAANFVVEGHSDATGSEGYNLSLSEQRARSVTDFLLARGISAEKLKVVGLGESDPRTPDPFDPENRRVEMKIRLQ